MFLTNSHQPVPVPPSPCNSVPSQNPNIPHNFNKSLSARLLSLLPASKIDLSWLPLATQVLSSTLNDTTSLILLNPSSLPPSRFLDSTSLSLLDSCNEISSFTDRLLDRLMVLQFSLRTHKPIKFEVAPLNEIKKMHHFSSLKAPRGEISPVQNAIYAVEMVSSLVISAVSVILSGKGKENFRGLKVQSEIFSWGKEFNEVVEDLYARIGPSCVVVELERLEKMEMNGRKKEMERMREGLERFKGSVDAVFRAALCARNAAVQNLRVSPIKKLK